MKLRSKVVVLLISLFLLSAFQWSLFAQASNEFKIQPNKAFKVGEKLTFDVKYGFVTAGIAIQFQVLISFTRSVIDTKLILM